MTEQELKDTILDLMKGKEYKGPEYFIYVGGHMNEDGNLVIPYLDDFDKAIKAELNKYTDNNE